MELKCHDTVPTASLDVIYTLGWGCIGAVEGERGRKGETLTAGSHRESIVGKRKKLKAIGSPEQINICKLTIITIFLNFFEEVFGCNLVVISST